MVAEGAEVIGQRLAACVVVRGDRAEVLVGMAAVEQHHRKARRLAALGEVGRQRHRGEDDTVDLVVHDLGHDLVDVVDVDRGEKDEDVVADLLQLTREAFDHLGVEVVFKVGDDEADDAGLAGLHRAGQDVRAVAQLFGGRADLIGGLFRDRGAGGEDAADGGLADARECRHFQRCYLFGHVPLCLAGKVLGEIGAAGKSVIGVGRSGRRRGGSCRTEWRRGGGRRCRYGSPWAHGWRRGPRRSGPRRGWRRREVPSSRRAQ